MVWGADGSAGQTGGRRCAGCCCARRCAGCGGGDSGGADRRLRRRFPPRRRRARRCSSTRRCRPPGRSPAGPVTCPSRAFTADPATDQGLPVPLGGAPHGPAGLSQCAFAGVRHAHAGVLPRRRHADRRLLPRWPRLLARGAGAAALHHRVRDGQRATRPRSSRACRPRRRRSRCSRRPSARTVLADPDAALARHRRARSPPTRPRRRSFTPSAASSTPGWPGRRSSAPRELNGLALFNNPGKGNCTACHPSARQGYSQHPLFTDFTYDNIGVPRNWNIPANLPNPMSPVSGVPLDYLPQQLNRAGRCAVRLLRHWDCAGRSQPPANDPEPRTDFTRATWVCGVFKVPTLRNVAITAPYFHNGALPTLHKVVQFYVTRDINNNTGNNPLPVPAGPRRQSLPGGRHLLHGRRRHARPVPVQRPAGGLRCQRQRRGDAVHAAEPSPAATRRRSPPPRSMTWWRSCARSPTATTRSSLPPTTCRRSARRARTDR